ncbi:MAG: hypothetical protein Cons2KO_29590 [Congregibacter sp.]
MQDSEELAQRVEREIAASSTTSRTPPGQTRSPNEGASKTDPALVDAINQVFALFRLNYHNQYYAAYSEAEQLRQIKKLWLESLRDYPPVQILQGARRAIENSEYLPTLHRIRQCCQESLAELGLPEARQAFLEASNAGAPPEANVWSHAVVYWAGRDCGWHWLSTTNETQSWPGFLEHYQKRCAQVLRGDGIAPVPEAQTPVLTTKPLEGDAVKAALDKLRSDNAL